MVETPPEDLLEWLTREEEEFGTARVEGAATDYARARDLLYESLGYEPSEEQVGGFMEVAMVKHEILLELGVSMIPIERPWGKTYSYYNYATHRFAKVTDVMEAVRRWSPAPPHRFR